jgi:fermentation-respiration switch protein FrsA (DUF1100 family)
LPVGLDHLPPSGHTLRHSLGDVSAEPAVKEAVTFYSEGGKLVGDLYLPPDVGSAERRAGIVLCHGYTGVKDLYLPDNARALTQAGYVALTFDYKGWGDSEGPRSRLVPRSA